MAHRGKWDSIKFLESTVNVRRSLKEATGREPSANSAMGIAVCLQQGRLFYEAAEQGPLEIKPLLIFYGMVNLSKALVLGRTGANLENLPQNHGLKDISPGNATLEKLTVKVEGSGTFQKFNDIVCSIDGFTRCWFNECKQIVIPTAGSRALAGKTFELMALLRRIPRIAELYSRTFEEDAGVEKCLVSHEDYDRDSGFAVGGMTMLFIRQPRVFHDADERQDIIQKLVQRFPCLRKCCLVCAGIAEDTSYFKFANLDKEKISTWPVSERSDGRYELMWREQPDVEDCVSQPIEELLDPVAGGILEPYALYLMEAIDGAYISEMSLYYMGMNLLSSLVRYRPNIWARSISRLRVAGENADDRALALVESFMQASMEVFPSRIVDLLMLKQTTGRVTAP